MHIGLSNVFAFLKSALSICLDPMRSSMLFETDDHKDFHDSGYGKDFGEGKVLLGFERFHVFLEK